MALIDGQPRSASAVLLEDANLLRISKEDFEMLLSSEPDIALSLMRTLAARLREAEGGK